MIKVKILLSLFLLLLDGGSCFGFKKLDEQPYVDSQEEETCQPHVKEHIMTEKLEPVCTKEPHPLRAHPGDDKSQRLDPTEWDELW